MGSPEAARRRRRPAPSFGWFAGHLWGSPAGRASPHPSQDIPPVQVSVSKCPLCVRTPGMTGWGPLAHTISSELSLLQAYRVTSRGPRG